MAQLYLVALVEGSLFVFFNQAAEITAMLAGAPLGGAPFAKVAN